MIQILRLEEHRRAVDDFCIRSLRMVVSEICHRNDCIQFAHDVHPLLHLHHIGILPFQETANQEEVAQHEGISEEETEKVATTVVPLEDFLELNKGRKRLRKRRLHLLPQLATEMATGYKLEYLRVSHQLVAELTAMAVNLVQGLLADKEHHHVLNHHPPKGDVHRNHAKDRKQHRGTYTNDECPTEKERSLRTIPRRHCHCRNLANGFSHCRGIYLAITHYPSDWFCRHIDMKTVRVVGFWRIKHLLFIPLSQSQELHSP